MTLVDTGPIVAMIDASDEDHAECVATFERLRAPLATTWPVVTEAMHLLGARLGRKRRWAGQEPLWRLVLSNALVLHDLPKESIARMHELMQKYADVPMDLADASLVALAELLNTRRVFTIDSDFLAYRKNGRVPFELVP